MKRKTNFSKKYLNYRFLPYFVTDEESKGPSVDTKLILKTVSLYRPKVKYQDRTIIVTQMIPRCVERNKKEIIRALYMEADNLFTVYNFKVNIVLEYE